VNAIAPGPVISERYDRIAEANAAVLDQPGAPASTVAPVGDQATPDSIADVAVFLASQRSRQFTGLVLQADGGATTSL